MFAKRGCSPIRRGCARSGRLELSIATEGWKFPAPPADFAPPPRLAKRSARRPARGQAADAIRQGRSPAKPRIRPKPTADTVLFKDRLLCLLQPPLDGLFDGRQLQVPVRAVPVSARRDRVSDAAASGAPRRRDGTRQDRPGDPVDAVAVPPGGDPQRAGGLPEAAGPQLGTRTQDVGAGHSVRDDRRRPGPPPLDLARLELPAQARELRDGHPRRRSRVRSRGSSSTSSCSTRLSASRTGTRRRRRWSVP